MRFKEWVQTVPEEIRNDSIWRMQVYKYSLFLSDIAWQDISELSKNEILTSLCDQLYRATGSVAANIEEGYSKKSHLDRARYFEYALGSARESRGWYYRARHTLSQNRFKSRLVLITEIIRLLLHIVPRVRKDKIKEPEIEYATHTLDGKSEKVENLNFDLTK